jgi:glucosamine--fructose-6-phosphate aminotransferase (isomerizing)
MSGEPAYRATRDPMNAPMTRMAQEIGDTPAAVARQERGLAPSLAELVARLQHRPPQVVVTCARGSSAHAATFCKHLFERYLGFPVAAAAPSVASIYRGRLRLRGQLVLVISQSGRSDDLIAFALSAKAAGAHTVAVTNDTHAPLAAACDIVLPIGAGSELSVAATKTFVATVSALVRLTAAWTGDIHLTSAASRLPRRLAQAAALDWDAALRTLPMTSSLVAIGRGPTLAIAREAALKLKEICSLHAEAFSGAEFMHGPVALASARNPALMFMPTDAAAAGMERLAADLHAQGTPVLVAGRWPRDKGGLPTLDPDQPEADAICLVQSFYAMVVRLAARLGKDADRPHNLEKITRTT